MPQKPGSMYHNIKQQADYRLKIRVYPHHTVRENKQATSASADCVSRGNHTSFGRAVGTTARVTNHPIIISVETLGRNIKFVRYALKKTAYMVIPSYEIKIAS